jgi:hypothetical protein
VVCLPHIFVVQGIVEDAAGGWNEGEASHCQQLKKLTTEYGCRVRQLKSLSLNKMIPIPIEQEEGKEMKQKHSWEITDEFWGRFNH